MPYYTPPHPSVNGKTHWPPRLDGEALYLRAGAWYKATVSVDAGGPLTGRETLVSEDIQIVVLDDDPTGIQTVYGNLLFTRWDVDTLRHGFEHDCPFFYVLTNTRAFTRDRAREIVAEVTRNVLAVNRTYGRLLVFISRSDSTLRSHFPAEIDAIVEVVEREDGQPLDAIFMVPAFFEGGRVTAGDVHYLVDGGQRVPTAETEYARDSVFGYSTSRLPDYIEEKTGGRVRAASVQSVSLDLLRNASPGVLAGLLDGLRGRTFVVVNAENYADLNRFAEAVLAAARRGKRFAFQSAASVVKALTRLPDRPLLGPEIVRGRPGPGLFVVGSHVERTSRQLEALLARPFIQGEEVDVGEVLRCFDVLLETTLERVQAAWSAGRTPVVYTSRKELTFDSAEERLEAGQTISRFLAQVVRRLPAPLAFLVAKGGITSHDILMRGLEADRATVLGQILPGVPVVSALAGSRFEGMPYVIFPGNVGGDDALVRTYETLRSGPTAP